MKRTFYFSELSKTAQINAAVNFMMMWNAEGNTQLETIEDAIADLECCDDPDRPDNERPKYTTEGEDA